MVNIVYNSINKYFTHLFNTGYFKQSEVNKLLVLMFILELLDNDFRGMISEDDYNIINKALYCLYGSNCLIPYPDYYNNKKRKAMYIGSISELTHRVEELEEAMKEGGGSGGGSYILDKSIIVPGVIDIETTYNISPGTEQSNNDNE